MKKILVVGSINMDLVVDTDEIPKVGETVIANTLSQIPGGKGANQAVAIAKIGGKVNFLGKIGNDSFGESVLESMKDSGVNTNHIEKIEGTTGTAIINVDNEGNNNIVVISGANESVDIDYLYRHKRSFAEADLVVHQLEIPLNTVRESLKISKQLGKITILNPAPALILDKEIISYIDILIPNEHELARMAGIPIHDEESMITASRILMEQGVKRIIVTVGSKGVFYIDEEIQQHYDAFKVNVIDTTAAGDCFIGGFAKSYVEEGNISKAIETGQMAAALAIQKFGAQSSIPCKEELINFRNNLSKLPK